jgi:geranylgeranyl pyrophosphate synthase
MVNVKEAVGIAFQYMNDLYDTTKFHDFLLEEVELSEDGRWWLVTIGWSRATHPDEVIQTPMTNTILGQSKIQYRRTYKVFKIDATNGEVRSMKIRET